MAVDDIRQNPMMAHLLDALEHQQDLGHYGRLVFAMVGRFFLTEDELVSWLTRNPGFSELEARALVVEVQTRGYNPPRQNRVLQWQKRQDFPICPNPDDPNACDVYHDLRFPDEVYQNIEEYYEQLVRDDADHPEDHHADKQKSRERGPERSGGDDHSGAKTRSRASSKT